MASGAASLLRALPAAPAASLRPADVLALQRSIGNRATGQVLAAALSRPGPAAGLRIQRYPEKKEVDDLRAKASELIEKLGAKDKAFVQANWRQIDTVWAGFERLYDVLGEYEDDDEASEDRGELYGGKWELADALEPLGVDMGNAGLGPVKDDYIRERLASVGKGSAANQAVAEQALKLGGQVAWVPGGGEVTREQFKEREKFYDGKVVKDDGGEFVQVRNDFREWILGKQDAPALPTMNCWEAVFFAGITAGVLNPEPIAAIYKENAERAGNYLSDAVQASLGPSVPLLDVMDAGGLASGDVLIFDGVVDEHVAISLGGKHVMSLWSHPGPHPLLQETTLEDLAGKKYPLHAIRVARSFSKSLVKEK